MERKVLLRYALLLASDQHLDAVISVFYGQSFVSTERHFNRSSINTISIDGVLQTGIRHFWNAVEPSFVRERACIWKTSDSLAHSESS